MSQRNTTPNTATYVLGRAKVFFSKLGDGDRPLGFHFVGNCPGVNAEVDSEQFEHLRSVRGMRVKDLGIITQQTLNWSLVLENLDVENIAKFFSGYSEEISGESFSDEVLVADGELEIEGLWYSLYDSGGHLVTGLEEGALTLTSTEDVPVELVSGTDYELDAASGRVIFLDTSATQAIVSAGKGVTASV